MQYDFIPDSWTRPRLLWHELIISILALAIVGSAIGYQALAIGTGHLPESLPEWQSIALGSVISYYFGAQTRRSSGRSRELRDGSIETQHQEVA